VLRSYRLKLNRAREHLGTLQDKITTWKGADPKPYEVVTHLQPEKLERVWRIRIRKFPPDEWSVLVGDFLLNARSALDHMAFLLAEAGDSAKAAQDRDKISFPICDRPSQWPEPNSPKVRAIESRARTEIERAQPYSAIAPGVTDDNARIRLARTQPLWILSQLNNADKHRSVRATFLSAPPSSAFST
jgi:hypothetical protein